ncbi:MAG: T9SS type A sorting domain-containing protein, partial [Flavisolibacter sp.]
LYGDVGVNGVIVITTKYGFKKQLLILDENDRLPIIGASVALIHRRDTVFQIANKSGIVSFDRKLLQHEYKLEVTCIGYEKKSVWVSNSYDSTITLGRKIDQMDSVVVRSYNCTRRISCGGRCFSIINNKGMTREEVSLKSYSVYPNPARPGTSIQIKLFTSFSGKIQLFNMAGQEIHSAFLKTVKMGIINYILPSVPSGNYIIRLTDHNLLSAFSEKIIVQ